MSRLPKLYAILDRSCFLDSEDLYEADEDLARNFQPPRTPRTPRNLELMSRLSKLYAILDRSCFLDSEDLYEADEDLAKNFNRRERQGRREI